MKGVLKNTHPLRVISAITDTDIDDIHKHLQNLIDSIVDHSAGATEDLNNLMDAVTPLLDMLNIKYRVDIEDNEKFIYLDIDDFEKAKENIKQDPKGDL